MAADDVRRVSAGTAEPTQPCASTAPGMHRANLHCDIVRPVQTHCRCKRAALRTSSHRAAAQHQLISHRPGRNCQANPVLLEVEGPPRHLVDRR